MIDQGNDTVWTRAGRHELEVEIIPDGMTMDDANARAMRYARKMKMNEKTAVGGEAVHPMMQRQAGSAREVSSPAAGSLPCARACGCA